MRISDSARISMVFLLAGLAAACSEPPAPPKASPAPTPVAAPASPGPPAPAAPAEPAAVAPTPPPGPPSVAEPAPSAPPAGPVAKSAPPPPSRPAVARPEAPVREKLGAGQCRKCHRIQYDSWVKSGHARKGLDCEGCHGDGSEYATASVMKDPARAKAAGLIFQTAAFCEKCHPTADDSFLPQAHAHAKKK